MSLTHPRISLVIHTQVSPQQPRPLPPITALTHKIQLPRYEMQRCQDADADADVKERNVICALAFVLSGVESCPLLRKLVRYLLLAPPRIRKLSDPDLSEDSKCVNWGELIYLLPSRWEVGKSEVR